MVSSLNLELPAEALQHFNTVINVSKKKLTRDLFSIHNLSVKNNFNGTRRLTTFRGLAMAHVIKSLVEIHRWICSKIVYNPVENPLIFYITGIWCLSKIWQWIRRSNATVWEIYWNRFLDFYGEDEYKVLFIGTGTLSVVVIFSICSMFLLMDIYLSPTAMRKYKVQPGMNEPIDKAKLQKAIRLVLLNYIFVNIPFGYCFYRTMIWRGVKNFRDLESFPMTILNVSFCFLAYDITFYLTHRLLHHKWFYKNVHKIHHEWTASTALVALYAHPIEHLMSNLLSVFIGIVLSGCQISTAWLWLSYVLTTTLGDHSGYHLPFLHSSEFHDYHHLKFTVNYGATRLMDTLFHSDKSFCNTINETRHRTLVTLQSAREKFPDTTANKEK